MTVLNVEGVCTSIADTFAAVADVNLVWNIDEILDNIPDGDMPLLMVYPESTEFDVGSGTQMTTFGGGAKRPVVQEETTIRADTYVSKVGGKPLREVLLLQTQLWDVLKSTLSAQTVKPYFGNEQIKSFQASMSRVIFPFSSYTFYGIQIDIVIREF
jgi:hypothetical protein